MNINKLLTVTILSTNIITSSFGTDVESDVERVKIAIVGGGIAGLTTAFHVQNNDLSVHLFEARDRLGGRVNTCYLNPEKTQYFEEGGTTIDSDHEETIKLMKELKVPLIKIGMGDGKLSVINEDQEVDSHALVQALKESSGLFEQQWSSIESDSCKLMVPDKNWVWRYKPLFDILELCENPIAKAFWKTYIQDEYGINPELAPITSINWLKEKAKEFVSLIETRISRSVPTFLINEFAYSYQAEGGISCLVDALKNRIESSTTIHYEHILRTISKTDTNYSLIFETLQGQKTVISEKVVMTDYAVHHFT